MNEKLVIEIEYMRDPTLRLTTRRLRQLILDRAAERLTTGGRHGQQPGVSIEVLTINGERTEF